MLRSYLAYLEDVVKRYWPGLLLVALAIFVLMRALWFMRVVALVLVSLILLTVLAGAGLALYNHLSGASREPRFLARLGERADRARGRIKKLVEEQKSIDRKIVELKALDPQASGKQWSKSLALLNGYEEELALRRTKVDFYRQSLRSLQELDQKWRQERKLNAMERDLEQLRTPNPSETRRMKSLREELVLEYELLATYQTLSKRLDRADNVASAKSLRRDLDMLLP